YSKNCIQIPKINWNGPIKKNGKYTTLAEEMVKRGTPIVLKNTVVNSHWSALKKWNPNYLKRKIPKLNNVFKSKNRVFGPHYSKDRIMSQLSTVQRDPNSFIVFINFLIYQI